jgi:RecA-family ATPase
MTDIDQVEIPATLYEAVASWRRTLRHAIDANKRSLFQKAAIELWAFERINQTENPPAADVVHDYVGRELADMADYNGIDPDDAQFMSARARTAPPEQPSNFHAVGDQVAKSPPATPPIMSAAEWQDRPIPERGWLVRDRIPTNNVTNLSGDGGIGKTLIALDLAAATVLGTDWLGKMVENPGGALFYTGEEDRDEVQRRLAAILRYRQRDFRDLANLHICSVAGADAVLLAPDKAGLIQPTKLYAHLLQAAGDLKPALTVIESAADVFAGNENDRPQVRQAVALFRRLAIVAQGSVLLLSHPSVSGMADKSGRSGSTGWNNSVRARLYLRKVDQTDEAADDNVRQLQIMKSNYGPAGETVAVQWKDGVFIPLAKPSTVERAAAERAIDAAFLACLEACAGYGRDVGPNTGRAYAPAIFEKMPEANGFRAKALAAAQERLFNAGAIVVTKIGPPSKARDRIVRKVVES